MTAPAFLHPWLDAALREMPQVVRDRLSGEYAAHAEALSEGGQSAAEVLGSV